MLQIKELLSFVMSGYHFPSATSGYIVGIPAISFSSILFFVQIEKSINYIVCVLLTTNLG